MSIVSDCKARVLAGEQLSRRDALALADAPLPELTQAADELRRHFCGDKFDLCTIVNAKSGRCPEDCKYCAQSAHWNGQVQEYPLLSAQELVEHARQNAAGGVLRYSIVTSGRRLTDAEVDDICAAVRRIRAEVGIQVCISAGLLSQEQFARLRQAGVSRVHNNLEASPGFFPTLCTTHTHADKIAAIRAAQAAGLTVCSGGIIGLGETMADRIDLALAVRELGVKSMPVNVLTPIPGTPLEHAEPLTQSEILRTVAIFRFLLPDGAIRLAGGRGRMADKGRACFAGGSNAAISGDMLTTSGITIAADQALLAELGYRPALLEA